MIKRLTTEKDRQNLKTINFLRDKTEKDLTDQDIKKLVIVMAQKFSFLK